MFILARAVVYGTFFVGFLLVFVPARVLARFDVVPSGSLGALQIAGVLLATGGAALAIACILSFVRFGRRRFGASYEAYCGEVRGWWPRRASRQP